MSMNTALTLIACFVAVALFVPFIIPGIRGLTIVPICSILILCICAQVWIHGNTAEKWYNSLSESEIITAAAAEITDSFVNVEDVTVVKKTRKSYYIYINDEQQLMYRIYLNAKEAHPAIAVEPVISGHTHLSFNEWRDNNVVF